MPVPKRHAPISLSRHWASLGHFSETGNIWVRSIGLCNECLQLQIEACANQLRFLFHCDGRSSWLTCHPFRLKHSLSLLSVPTQGTAWPMEAQDIRKETQHVLRGSCHQIGDFGLGQSKAFLACSQAGFCRDALFL